MHCGYRHFYMAIKYLKKSPKTSSTDDTKTAQIVQGLLNDLEKSKEQGCIDLTKKFDKYDGEIIVSKERIEEIKKTLDQKTNYDVEAIVDCDDCCLYPDDVGCTDIEACNYGEYDVSCDNCCDYGSSYYLDTDGDGLGYGPGEVYCSEDVPNGWVSNNEVFNPLHLHSSYTK